MQIKNAWYATLLASVPNRSHDEAVECRDIKKEANFLLSPSSYLVSFSLIACADTAIYCRYNVASCRNLAHKSIMKQYSAWSYGFCRNSDTRKFSLLSESSFLLCSVRLNMRNFEKKTNEYVYKKFNDVYEAISKNNWQFLINYQLALHIKKWETEFGKFLDLFISLQAVIEFGFQAPCVDSARNCGT